MSARRRGTSKVEITPEHLDCVEVLRGLGEEQRGDLLGRVRGYRYPKGQEIVTHGDTTQDVYFIVEGEARVNIFSAAGRHITYEVLSSGEMFGEIAALDGGARSASVIAETDALVIRISAQDYLELMRGSPDVAEYSLRHLARMVRHLSWLVYESYALPVAARIDAELLRVARRHDVGEIPIRVLSGPTDRDIASRVGTTREAVNREIAYLVSARWVERDGKDMLFHDAPALEQRLRELEEG